MGIDVKLVKIGNSITLRIPKLVATQLHLEAGSIAELFFDETQMSIRPKKKNRKMAYSLDELVKGITSQNCHTEHFDDTPIGAEFV
jgi:antitoxin component of MazEF toxin-antitoxin module